MFGNNAKLNRTTKIIVLKQLSMGNGTWCIIKRNGDVEIQTSNVVARNLKRVMKSTKTIIVCPTWEETF